MPADSPAVTHAIAYARANRARFVNELCEFLRIPSVSGSSAHRAAIGDAARFLVGALRAAGATNARTRATPGAPLVVADCGSEARQRPAIIVYGHYDVVPPGALHRWRTPPFAPRLAGGAIYARGASDDKGQLFAHVKALEAWTATHGETPLGVQYLFEGDEEIGSTGLLARLREHSNGLGADAALISDTRMRAPDRPAITYALRGKLMLELRVTRQGGELHAGDFAGAVPDPGATLARMIASLTDGMGRLIIAQAHRRVRALPERERAALTQPERRTLEPSCTAVEVDVGDVGDPKSTIPTAARAVLDVRLVPDQDPREMAELIEQRARGVLHDGESLEVRVRAAARPVVIDPHDPFIRAAAQAAEKTFGHPAVLARSGGSIPLATALHDAGITPVLLGFALSSDGMHAANEHFAVARFMRAIECSIRFLAEAARSRHGTHAGASVGIGRAAAPSHALNRRWAEFHRLA